MTSRSPSHPAQTAAILVLLCGLALILGATLFPYDFSFAEHDSLRNSFRLSTSLKQRGTDLLIGVDGELGQGFKGRIDDLRLYRRGLTAAEIAALSIQSPSGPGGDLVASWPFDEPVGNVARDDSSNGNDGVLEHGPERIPGHSGRALRFNAAGQFVRVPNSPSLDISGKGITISMWLALEDRPDGADQVIVAKPWKPNSMEPPFYQYGVEFDATGGRSVDFFFGDASARGRGPFSLKVPVGIWSHVAFAYDGNIVRGYVNGREQLATGVADPWEIGDLVANLLLFMPLGFGLSALARARGLPATRAIAAGLALGALLSLAVEFLQTGLPTRNSSLIDVASNSIGTIIGLGCFYAGGSRFCFRLGHILDRLKAWPATRTLLVLAIAYAVAALCMTLALQSASRLDWDENFSLVLGNNRQGNKPWQGRILSLDLSNDPGSDVLVSYDFTTGIVSQEGTGRTHGLQWQGDPPLPDRRAGVLLSQAAWLATPDGGPDGVGPRKLTNSFTLRIRCATESVLQRGPARIVALSGQRQNFKLDLAQDGPDLVVEFRTLITGQREMLPQLVVPGVFHGTGPQDLLVTYDGRQLRLFVDGSLENQSLILGPGATLFSYFQPLKVEEMRGYEILYYLCVLLPLGCVVAVVTGRTGSNIRAK